MKDSKYSNGVRNLEHMFKYLILTWHSFWSETIVVFGYICYKLILNIVQIKVYILFRQRNSI